MHAVYTCTLVSCLLHSATYICVHVDASSNSLSSAPPTPPISRIQSTLEYDTHPIFPSTVGPAHHTVATPLSMAPQPFATQHQVTSGTVLNDDDDVITTLSSLTASEQGMGMGLSHGHQHTLLQQHPMELQGVSIL